LAIVTVFDKRARWWLRTTLHHMLTLGSYGVEMLSALSFMAWSVALMLKPPTTAYTSFGVFLRDHYPAAAIAMLVIGLVHWCALYRCIQVRYVRLRPCSLRVVAVQTAAVFCSLGVWASLAAALFAVVSTTPTFRPFAVLLSIVCLFLVYALWRRD
jgi:hypothetical protein